MGLLNNYYTNTDNYMLYRHMGDNGILYEYHVPYGYNPNHFYEEAVDVQSRKKSKVRYDNGKRPGQYQPVGDKGHFTFYELRKIRNEKMKQDYLKIIVEILEQLYAKTE